MKLVKRVKPMISVAAMTGLLEAIRDAGADPDQVLRTFELEPSVLANVDGFIPCAVFARILEEAARATGDDCFGLHFGERFNPKNIGPLAYAVLNSPTVGEADAQVARYIKLYNQAAQASVIIEGQRAYMRYVLTGLDIPTARQQNEYGMAVRLNTIRMMVGSQWAPLEVQFAHEEPANTSEHERIFRRACFVRLSRRIIFSSKLSSSTQGARGGHGNLPHREALSRRVLKAMPQEDVLTHLGAQSRCRVGQEWRTKPWTDRQENGDESAHIAEAREGARHGFQKSCGRHAPAICPDLPQRPQKRAYGNRVSLGVFRCQRF